MPTRERLLLVVLVGFLALGIFCAIDGPLITVVVCVLGLIGTAANLSQGRARRKAGRP